MTQVLRNAHLKIAHHVCNPEVGKREGNPTSNRLLTSFWSARDQPPIYQRSVCDQ